MPKSKKTTSRADALVTLIVKPISKVARLPVEGKKRGAPAPWWPEIVTVVTELNHADGWIEVRGWTAGISVKDRLRRRHLADAIGQWFELYGKAWRFEIVDKDGTTTPIEIAAG